MDQIQGPNEQPLNDGKQPTIRGADAIAEYLFGNRRHRRRVYHFSALSKLPLFKMGGTLCLRPKTYEEFVRAQEEIVLRKNEEV